MKPTTLIEYGLAATLATAFPTWGCDENQIYPSHTIHEKISSNIIDDSPVKTEIISSIITDVAYSGYELLKMDLKDYLNLDDGWDDVDSKAPSAEAVSMAIQFIDKLPSGIPLPKSMLSSSGEVGLYWDIGDIYADVGFEEDNVVSIFLRDRRDENRESWVELRLFDTKTDQLKDILSPLELA